MKHHALALFTLLLALPARAEVIDIQWAADGSFALQRSVPAGKVVEVCGKVAAGVRVAWAYEASAPLDFNVHYHVGKDVVFPKQLEHTAAAKDTLAAATEQDYCWMWSNKNKAAAQLSLTLRR